MSSESLVLVDDLSIADDTIVWRRIPPWHVKNEGDNTFRPSSAAFEDSPGGDPMSVILSSDGTIARAMQGHKGFLLVGVRMCDARELRLGIVRAPLPEEPAHAKLFGPKTRAVRRQLAKRCEWVIMPPRV